MAALLSLRRLGAKEAKAKLEEAGNMSKRGRKPGCRFVTEEVLTG